MSDLQLLLLLRSHLSVVLELVTSCDWQLLVTVNNRGSAHSVEHVVCGGRLMQTSKRLQRHKKKYDSTAIQQVQYSHQEMT